MEGSLDPDRTPETAPDAPPDLGRRLGRGMASGALAAGAVILALAVLSQTVLQEGALWSILAGARWGLVALAAVVMGLAFLSMGMQWRSLMPRETRGSPLGLTSMLLAGLLLNYAVPGPVGEVGAAWLAHRRYGVPLLDSVASGAASRVVGLATAALLALLTWALTAVPVPAGYGRWVGLSALIIGAGGGLLAFLALKPLLWQQVFTRVLGLLHRRPALRGLSLRAERLLVTSTEALASVVRRGRRAYGQTAAWAAVSHGMVTLALGLLAGAFGVWPSPAALLFAYAMSTAGGVALSLFPGSQISRDAVLTGLLVAITQLPLANAVAVAATLRLVQVACQALGGLSVAILLRGARR